MRAVRSTSFPVLFLLATGLPFAAPASADWKPGNPDVATAAKDVRIAAVLAAVNALDRAAVRDDHAAFSALLAEEVAVNNPQNGVSVAGATARRSAAGQISYARYDRVIEYAGLRGDMVILMGEEVVLPKSGGVPAMREIHRRFTDLWRPVGTGWKLSARQATVITRP